MPGVSLAYGGSILKRTNLLAVMGLALTVVVNAGTLEAQSDPGPRGGPAGGGDSSLA